MNSRAVDFELRGVTYPLCFTLEAADQFYQRYGAIDGWFDRLKEYSYQDEEHPGDTIKLFAEYLWLLDTLMQAGYEYCAWDREEAELPPGLDELRKLLCVGDISRMQTSVIETITRGNVREVGAAAPKNGEGAPDAV